jgi:hypothetical protein
MLVDAQARRQAMSATLYESLRMKYYNLDAQLRTSFTVQNAVKGKIVPVGTIKDGQFTAADRAIVYPGGTDEKPIPMPVFITFTWATREFVTFSQESNPIYTLVRLGGEVGFGEIMMNPTILSNHILNPVNTDLPVDYFHQQMAEGWFFEKMGRLGVAMFGVPNDVVAEGIMDIEAKFGFLLPKVFSSPLHTKLSDPVKYPLFNRVAITNREFAISCVAMFRYF